LLGLAVAVSPAYADTELVVLGPVGKGDVAGVKAALGKVDGATRSPKSIDAGCATDPACLMTTGTELGARRVLAVSFGGGAALKLTLVDVHAKVLLGVRDLDIRGKKRSNELPGAIRKFVDETIVTKARALFEEGNNHYKLGEFTQALDKYKLAYRVKPLAAFQFNIAQCHRKLGQHKEAIAMYQAYLVDVPEAQNKAMVDSLIAEEKKAVSEQTASEDSRER
jgi:tetratricopeptide (TPR) repeat protein